MGSPRTGLRTTVLSRSSASSRTWLRVGFKEKLNTFQYVSERNQRRRALAGTVRPEGVLPWQCPSPRVERGRGSFRSRVQEQCPQRARARKTGRLASQPRMSHRADGDVGKKKEADSSVRPALLCSAHIGFEPAEDALPAFAVCGGRRKVAGKSFLAHAQQRSRTGLFRAGGMQCVHRLRLKLPSHNGPGAIVAAIPGMDEQTRRIDFEIFPLDPESPAVGANAVAAPLATGAHVHGGFGDVIKAVLPPPLGKLCWIADRLKNTSRRSGDEDFGDDCVLIGREDGRSHGCSLNDFPGRDGESLMTLFDPGRSRLSPTKP